MNIENKELAYGDGLVPLWFWDDEMTKEKITCQMNDMFSNGIKEFFIVFPVFEKNPETKWMSSEWMEKILFTAQLAENMKMKVWLHDEHGFPSGSAEGLVVAKNPELQSQCLEYQMVSVTGPLSFELPFSGKKLIKALAVPVHGMVLDGKGEDITGSFATEKGNWEVPEGEWRIFSFYHCFTDYPSNHIHGKYIDLLNPESALAFIESVHEPYRKALGKYFGNTIQGIFTDETGFYNLYISERAKNSIPWTGDFLKIFHLIKGYDLSDYLHGLWFDIGTETGKIRFDFYDVLSWQYAEAFFKPIYEWGTANKLMLAGHLNAEDHLPSLAPREGHIFRPLSYFHIPGVDFVFDLRFRWVAKLGASVAAAGGKKRCLNEVFGAFGWETTIEQMKLITDLNFSENINMIVPHAYWASEKSGYCPPAISPQSVWWKYFKVYSKYALNLTRVLADGQRVADVAVYYPMSSVWSRITPTGEGANDLDASFIAVSMALRNAQYDFDYIDDDWFKQAEVVDGRLKKGLQEFSVLVFSKLINIPAESLWKIKEFCRSGGLVVAVDALPQSVCGLNSIIDDSEVQNCMKEMFGEIKGKMNLYGRGKAVFYPSMSLFSERMANTIDSDFRILTPSQHVFYTHRKIKGEDVYFITNDSRDAIQTTVSFSARGLPYSWNPETDQLKKIFHFEFDNAGRTIFPLFLDACSSIVIVLRDEEDRGHIISTNAESVFEIEKNNAGLNANVLLKGSGEYYVNAVIDKKNWSGKINIGKFSEPILFSGDWSIFQGETYTGCKLGSWAEFPGYETFSGTMEYNAEFNIPEEYIGKILILDLGTVRDIAELNINGQTAGIRCWRPYRFDISSFIRKGHNEIKITVTNGMGNRMDKTAMESGLFGPVSFIPYEKHSVRLSVQK